MLADFGYSRNSRVQPLTPQQLATCGATGQPICPGVDAAVFKSGFAGLALHRALGHDFRAFASYQFNQLWFDHSYCPTTLPCPRIGDRQVATFGVDWTPRPIRLD